MAVRILYTEEFAPLFSLKPGQAEPDTAYLYLKDNTLFAGPAGAPFPDGIDPAAPELKWELTPFVSPDALNLLLDQVSDAAEKAAAGDARAVKLINDFCSFVEAELDAFTVGEYYADLSDGEIMAAIRSGEYIQKGVILTDLEAWKAQHGM
jgi:hypothetical protein